MSSIRTDITYLRNTDILATELEDEAVLLSIQKQCYFGLPTTSRRIWQLLAQPQTLDSICGTLQQEYAVDDTTCSREVTAFLDELNHENLIRIAAA